MQLVLKFCIVWVILHLGIKVEAQLINIESKRMHTDSIRFALQNDFDFSLTNNDGEFIYSITNDLTTQWKTADLNKIILLSGNYNLIRTENQDYANIWLAHLRFNYQLTSLFRFEIFLQAQHDEVLFITERRLAGVGIRLKLVSGKIFNLYVGNAYMFEYEKSDPYNSEEYYHRNSSYLSFSLNVPKTKLTVVNTCYFQPVYTRFKDFRFLEEMKLDYKITKIMSLYWRFTYYMDSITPQSEEESQYSYQSQFGIGIGINSKTK